MRTCLRIPRILLPREGFETWAVIACDQFSSDREYWRRVERCVGDAPSTLNFILPEADLGEDDAARIEEIRAAMYSALENDALSKLTRGLIREDLVAHERRSDGNPSHAQVRKSLHGRKVANAAARVD